MTETAVPEQPAGPFPCDECQAGVMRLRFITYFTWLSEELIMVPNFPAWVCDVCGRREYDEKSISWLTMLLSPEAGRAPHRRAQVTRGNRSATSRPSPQS